MVTYSLLAEILICYSRTLEKLTLVGLCSYNYYGIEEHKSTMEELFRPAMVPHGRIVFMDKQK